MTCYVGEGITICAPPRGVVCRRILRCPTCEQRRRFVQRFMGAWYGDLFTCVACGDSWGDGERLERPFQRGWRQRATAKARRAWTEALAADEFAARVHADLESAVAA